MCRFCCLTTILLATCVAGAGEKLRHVPSAAERAAAEKLVREIFQDDIAKVTPETKPGLVEKILAQVAETKDDPTGRYALLTLAASLAAQSGDLELYISCRTKLAAEFAIDMKQFSTEGFNTLSAATKDSALLKVIAAHKTLLDKPDDPAANLAAGRYAFFTKENIENGVELLIKSKHPVLKNLAHLEKSAPTEATEQAALGDQWWNFAENGAEKEDKLPAQKRAVLWYKKALPTFTGLTKLKIEKRVASVDASAAEEKPETKVAAKTSEAKQPAAKETMPAAKNPNVVESSLDLGGGVKLDLVQVKAGQFKMGSDDADASNWERPVQTVTITRPYWIGKYPVTIAQFKRFVEDAKYETEAEKEGFGNTVVNHRFSKTTGATWKNQGFEQGDDHPVVLVSWNDAQAFCAWLSTVSKKKARLPTEAEWEYAAAGPRALRFPWGNNWDGAKCNHADSALRASNIFFSNDPFTSETDGFVQTAPVGSFDNASWCGAYDMAGNVWQWVFNWFSKSYRTNQMPADPGGPAVGDKVRRDNKDVPMRVLKGGSWSNMPKSIRSPHSVYDPPDHRATTMGFRIAVQQ